jgi:hypothetical protein
MNNNQEWRYQYFNGWLPPGPVDNSWIHNSEIRAICDRIDARKVAIAQYVRKRYSGIFLVPDKE